MHKKLLQKLGFTENDRIVVINGDDFGMCHSANTATMKFLHDFPGNSATIMLPCPWSGEALQFWRANPGIHIGLELTLTSEWEHYRWGPLTSKDKVPSLIDRDGCFWGNTELVKEHVRAEEAEIEVRAQIERALKLELEPSHLANHMFVLHCRPDLMELYVRLAREYHLPARIKRLQDDPGWPSIDGMIGGETYSMGPHGREERLYEILREMKPGLWELYPHFNDDCAEARAIMSHSKFVPEDSNSWRGRNHDVEIYTGARFREFLTEQNIKRISSGQIRACIRKAK